MRLSKLLSLKLWYHTYRYTPPVRMRPIRENGLMERHSYRQHDVSLDVFEDLHKPRSGRPGFAMNSACGGDHAARNENRSGKLALQNRHDLQ